MVRYQEGKGNIFKMSKNDTQLLIMTFRQYLCLYTRTFLVQFALSYDSISELVACSNHIGITNCWKSKVIKIAHLPTCCCC